MPKEEVIVEVDLETGDFTIDNIGFKGSACADISKALDKLGTRTKTTKKPEFHQGARNASQSRN